MNGSWHKPIIHRKVISSPLVAQAKSRSEPKKA